MLYGEERDRPALGHRIILEDRARLTVSGVEEVERFDENSIFLLTGQGSLEIQGEGLHIEQLNLEAGRLDVTGVIEAIEYSELAPRRERRGLLFRRKR